MGALLFFAGCQASDHTPNPTDSDQSMLRRYGVISPLELNPDLSELDMQRMSMPLQTLRVEEWAPPAEPFTLPQKSYYQQLAEDTETPVEPEKAYLRGKWLLRQAEGTTRRDLFEQAVDEVSLGLIEEPCSPGLLELLGQLYYLQGRDRTAKTVCCQSVRLHQDSMKSWYLLAELLGNEGNYGQAASAVGRALQCTGATPGNPLTAMSHLKRATILDKQGYLSAASEAFQRAWVLLMQQRGYAQSNLTAAQLLNQMHILVIAHAFTELRLGNLAAAHHLIERAEKTMDGAGQYMNVFLMTLAGQKTALHKRYQMVRSMVRYLLVVEEDKENVLAMFYEAAREMAKYQSYLEDLARWSVPQPPDERALLSTRLYARGLALADQVDRAVKILQELSYRTTENGRVHYDLALLYQRQQDWYNLSRSLTAYLEEADDDETLKKRIEKVRMLLDKSVAGQKVQWDMLANWIEESSPRPSRHGLFLRGYLAEKLEHPDMAVRHYRQAIAGDPTCSPARKQLINILIGLKRPDEALEYITPKQTDPACLWLAARAHEGMGNLDQAAGFYRRLTAYHEDSLPIYLSLSRVLIRQGEYKAAEQLLLKIRSDNPDMIRVDHLMLMLYAGWGGQEDLPEAGRARLEARCWAFYEQWQTRLSRYPAAEQDEYRDSILKDIEILRRHDTRNRLSGILLLRLYESAGRREKALAHSEDLLQAWPEDMDIVKLAANLHQQAENVARSAQLWQELHRLEPDNSDILLDYVRSLRRARQIEKALALLSDEVRPGTHFDHLVAARRWQEEARQVFVLARDYTRAAATFTEWFDKIDTLFNEAPGDEKRDLLRLARENTIWALTQNNQFAAAVDQTLELYRRHPRQPILTALWVVRTLNIRLEFILSNRLLDEMMRLREQDHSLRTLYYTTLLEQNKTEQALTEVHRWWQGKPFQKIRQQIYMLIMQKAGQYQPLEELFNHELADDPEEDNLTLQWFDILLEAGDLEAAENLLLKYAPAPVESYLWFEAWIKLDIAGDNCDQALHRAERFADRFDGTISADPIKVNIYHLCNRIDDALALQKAILDKDPCNLEAVQNYCVFLDESGRSGEAVRCYEQLLERYPDNAELMNNAGYLMVENHIRPDAARRLIERSLQLDPEAAPTLDSLGWYYYKAGQFDQALDYISQSAAKMIVVDYELLDHLGDTLYRMGEKEKAYLYWQRAVRQLERRTVVEQYLRASLAIIREKVSDFENGRPVTTGELWRTS